MAEKSLYTNKVISITGDDTESFLQGQLTVDLNDISTEKSGMTAYVNAKGKIIWFGEIIKIKPNHFHLLVSEDLTDKLCSQLNKYKMIADVDIDVLPESIDFNLQTSINNNLPFINNENSELFFPHDLNLDLLKYVSFTKGCFRGQEIIARMQHLGKIKRRMYKLKIIANDKLSPNPKLMGNNIMNSNNEKIGTVICNTEDMALAVINIISDNLDCYLCEEYKLIKL